MVQGFRNHRRDDTTCAELDVYISSFQLRGDYACARHLITFKDIFPLTSLAREENATDIKETQSQRFMKYPTMHRAPQTCCNALLFI